MLSRERVIEVIEHRKPDRIPVHGWLVANLTDQIAAAFGSVEAFEDKYEFDYAHVFAGPGPHDGKVLESAAEQNGCPIDPAAMIDIPLNDPNDEAAYQGLRDALVHHGEKHGRFVYIQTPGIFECLNGVFGVEAHLMHLALHEKELHEVYRKQAEWNRQFAMNCIDLGVDMIHVSDDWGAQRGLLFSPDTWWKLMFPYHKITCDAVRDRGTYLSLHSDGNVDEVLDGIIELGYQVVHPFQESAGMDLLNFKSRHMDHFVVMGGIDVQTTIGFGDYDRLREEIERLVDMFSDGGLLLSTSHFVQDHCSMQELAFAYDLVYESVRR